MATEKDDAKIDMHVYNALTPPNSDDLVRKVYDEYKKDTDEKYEFGNVANPSVKLTEKCSLIIDSSNAKKLKQYLELILSFKPILKLYFEILASNLNSIKDELETIKNTSNVDKTSKQFLLLYFKMQYIDKILNNITNIHTINEYIEFKTAYSTILERYANNKKVKRDIGIGSKLPTIENDVFSKAFNTVHNLFIKLPELYKTENLTFKNPILPILKSGKITCTYREIIDNNKKIYKDFLATIIMIKKSTNNSINSLAFTILVDYKNLGKNLLVKHSIKTVEMKDCCINPTEGAYKLEKGIIKILQSRPIPMVIYDSSNANNNYALNTGSLINLYKLSKSDCIISLTCDNAVKLKRALEQKIYSVENADLSVNDQIVVVIGKNIKGKIVRINSSTVNFNPDEQFIKYSPDKKNPKIDIKPLSLPLYFFSNLCIGPFEKPVSDYSNKCYLDLIKEPPGYQQTKAPKAEVSEAEVSVPVPKAEVSVPVQKANDPPVFSNNAIETENKEAVEKKRKEEEEKKRKEEKKRIEKEEEEKKRIEKEEKKRIEILEKKRIEKAKEAKEAEKAEEEAEKIRQKEAITAAKTFDFGSAPSASNSTPSVFGSDPPVFGSTPLSIHGGKKPYRR